MTTYRHIELPIYISNSINDNNNNNSKYNNIIKTLL